MGTLGYLKNLVSDKNVSSITPTSSFGVKKVCSPIDFEQAKVFVEYGPGEGVFTKYLLENMRPDARLIVIETNKKFVKTLTGKFSDRRLSVVNGSAEDITKILRDHGLAHADFIISGIPFSLFPVELKNKILLATNEALTPQGRFLVYQFFVSFSAGKNDIKAKLKEYMQIVDSDIELLCIPPLRIYEAKRK